jgi:hypothetical protein
MSGRRNVKHKYKLITYRQFYSVIKWHYTKASSLESGNFNGLSLAWLIAAEIKQKSSIPVII